MSQESEIISFFSFSNNSRKLKNSKISLLAVYSIFCIFEADFKIRKMKKRSIFLTIFFFSIFVSTLKYVNMIRISNISFFRLCWKNGKLDWPKCARTVRAHFDQPNFHFSNKDGKRKCYLSLSYLHILNYRQKQKKRKWSGKLISFSFSNFEVRFKKTKNTVNG